MKKALVILLIFMSYFGQGQEGFLEQFEWKNRIVLVFGESSDSMVKNQIKELRKEPEGINDRDLLIIHIDKSVIFLNKEDNCSEADAARLRNQYNVPEKEFQYILLGLDGGVKYRKDTFVSNKALFAVIDVMPMRQREILENQE